MSVPRRIAKEYNDFCIIVGEPKIGEGTWIGYYTLLDASGGLKIGKWCDIISNVSIYTHDTVFRCLSGLKEGQPNKGREFISRAPVEIGDYCFIGANAVILKGTKIGHHSLVAAGAVVNGGTFPPYSFIAGLPAKWKGYIKLTKDDYYFETGHVIKR